MLSSGWRYLLTIMFILVVTGSHLFTEKSHWWLDFLLTNAHHRIWVFFYIFRSEAARSCSQCDVVATSVRALQIHFRNSHPDLECPRLECPMCLKKYVDLKAHAKFHNSLWSSRPSCHSSQPTFYLSIVSISFSCLLISFIFTFRRERVKHKFFFFWRMCSGHGWSKKPSSALSCFPSLP